VLAGLRECDLAEAKESVYFSSDWADRREEYDKFHAELEEIAKKIDEQSGVDGH
jgi:hypothetical protein